MADLIETNTTKTAVRTLETPISEASIFDSIITDILTTNPFECLSYASGGQMVSGVVKSKESYTAKFVFDVYDELRIVHRKKSIYNNLKL